MGTAELSTFYKGTACHLLAPSFLSGLQSHWEASLIGSELDGALQGHCDLPFPGYTLIFQVLFYLLGPRTH